MLPLLFQVHQLEKKAERLSLDKFSWMQDLNSAADPPQVVNVLVDPDIVQRRSQCPQ